MGIQLYIIIHNVICSIRNRQEPWVAPGPRYRSGMEDGVYIPLSSAPSPPPCRGWAVMPEKAPTSSSADAGSSGPSSSLEAAPSLRIQAAVEVATPLSTDAA